MKSLQLSAILLLFLNASIFGRPVADLKTLNETERLQLEKWQKIQLKMEETLSAEIWDDNNAVVAKGTTANTECEESDDSLIDSVDEKPHTLKKRGLFSKLLGSRNSNKVGPTKGRESCVNTGQYIFIGYHGTCSNHRSSIENRIVIPPTNQATFGPSAQLGRRFYTADFHKVAAAYSKHTCHASSISGSPKSSPILCSIYMKAEALKKIPKIYIPPAIYDSKDEEYDLWYEDNNIDYIESLAKFRVPPVRFGVMGSDMLYMEIQAAWPQHAVENMIAKCSYMENINEFDGQSKMKRVGYWDLMLASQRGEEWENWGESVMAADLYRHAPFENIFMRKENNVLHNLILKQGDSNP
ncbi:hypothetical protein BKA69DRAFT_1037711 [Paraphysoderma sedebokerense]|nr:hypothetical protein BKA69DRAFT_1037711 [Paraphysoderma sedebokerense]